MVVLVIVMVLVVVLGNCFYQFWSLGAATGYCCSAYDGTGYGSTDSGAHLVVLGIAVVLVVFPCVLLLILVMVAVLVLVVLVPIC